jgi:hypothetical protein
MEVACRLALESLPKLPNETEQALRHHIETLCEVTERELKRLKPAYTRVEPVDLGARIELARDLSRYTFALLDNPVGGAHLKNALHVERLVLSGK